MKAKFYDVKAKKSVEAEVTEAVAYPNNRFAFKGLTKDKRPLTTFVSAAAYAAFSGKKTAPKAAAKKAAPKAAAKKCCK
jgi:hypothetical protein